MTAKLACTLRLPIAVFLGLLVVRKWSPLPSFCVAAAITALAWILDYYTPIEEQFNVVYIMPEKAGADAEEVVDKKVRHVDGCKLKEMSANSKSLDIHLQERGLTRIECPLFKELDRDWYLYGRLANEPALPIAEEQPAAEIQETAAADAPADAPEALAAASEAAAESPEVIVLPRKKGRFNSFASQLCNVQLRGPAVVLPIDRSWKPTVLGRMDMLSGNAGRRQKEESVSKVVTIAGLIEVHAQGDKRAEDVATSVLEKMVGLTATLQGREGATLHKRREGDKGADEGADAMPVEDTLD